MYNCCVNIAKIDITLISGKLEILDIIKDSIEKNNLTLMLKLKHKFEYFGYCYSIYDSFPESNYDKEDAFTEIVQDFMLYFELINIMGIPRFNVEKGIRKNIKNNLFEKMEKFQKDC